jgi:hypothetical protein
MVTHMASQQRQHPHQRVIALVRVFKGAWVPGHDMGAKAPDHPITALCRAQDGAAEDSKA